MEKSHVHGLQDLILLTGTLPTLIHRILLLLILLSILFGIYIRILLLYTYIATLLITTVLYLFLARRVSQKFLDHFKIFFKVLESVKKISLGFRLWSYWICNLLSSFMSLVKLYTFLNTGLAYFYQYFFLIICIVFFMSTLFVSYFLTGYC